MLQHFAIAFRNTIILVSLYARNVRFPVRPAAKHLHALLARHQDHLHKGNVFAYQNITMTILTSNVKLVIIPVKHA